MTTVLPYGSWPSTISAEQLAVGGNRLGDPTWVGEHLWWTEGLAAEGGRQAIARTVAPVKTNSAGATATPTETVTVLPAPFNARSRVHEYGGRSWTVLDSKPVLNAETGPDSSETSPQVLFVNFDDQRIYSFLEGQAPIPLSPVGPEVASAGGPSLRWVDPTPVTLSDGTPEVWWVCEEHLEGTDAEAAPLIQRFIAAVPLDGTAAENPDAIRRITAASRFVAHPRISPDSGRVAWISWEHPQMPWDGTQLHIGQLTAEGVVEAEEIVDGGPEISILNPEWRSPEELIYISDRSGWWNPWTLTLGETPQQLREDSQEFAGPLWSAGDSWLELIDSDHALCIHGTTTDRLSVLNLRDGSLQPLNLPHTAIRALSLSNTGKLALLGVRADAFAAVDTAELKTADGAFSLTSLSTLRSSRQDAPDPALLPTPEPLTVQDSSGQKVHAVLYRPHQEGFTATDGELPPFIAQVHGGPTGKADVGLSLAVAYYTSRGIGVVDINYGGSTGFGRAYRERLKGQWGVVDVTDTVTVMEHLVAEEIADGDRLGIEGGSAGGWTTLACLTRTNVFSAGVSSFGVADAVALAQDTHDFESRYLDGLIGAYPEDEEIYIQRAPLNHVDSLNCPVLLLQGEEDRIVPPNQAEAFRDAMAAQGIPHAYLLFAGEQHGFRRAENIITSFEASLSFYGQIFGFTPVDIPVLALQTS